MKFDGILIASDVDGTLAHGTEISEENIEAIRYFTQNGGLFTLSTGRAYRYVNEHFSDSVVINAPLILLNGTQIVRETDGEVLWQGKMPESFKKLLVRIKETEPDVWVHVHTPHGETKHSFSPEDYVQGDYMKIVLVAEDEETPHRLKKILQPEFPEFEMYQSWNVSLEFNSNLAGKGNALKLVKEMTGAQIAIGVGDYGNDTSLLKEADIGIAVGNAIPELKETADFVTVPFEEHAIAHIIYHLEEFLKGDVKKVRTAKGLEKKQT